ncbi:hypothetical protein Tco_0526874 [Tanacetum coccineum]
METNSCHLSIEFRQRGVSTFPSPGGKGVFTCGAWAGEEHGDHGGRGGDRGSGKLWEGADWILRVGGGVGLLGNVWRGQGAWRVEGGDHSATRQLVGVGRRPRASRGIQLKTQRAELEGGGGGLRSVVAHWKCCSGRFVWGWEWDPYSVLKFPSLSVGPVCGPDETFVLGTSISVCDREHKASVSRSLPLDALVSLEPNISVHCLWGAVAFWMVAGYDFHPGRRFFVGLDELWLMVIVPCGHLPIGEEESRRGLADVGLHRAWGGGRLLWMSGGGWWGGNGSGEALREREGVKGGIVVKVIHCETMAEWVVGVRRDDGGEGGWVAWGGWARRAEWYRRGRGGVVRCFGVLAVGWFFLVRSTPMPGRA